MPKTVEMQYDPRMLADPVYREKKLRQNLEALKRAYHAYLKKKSFEAADNMYSETFNVMKDCLALRTIHKPILDKYKGKT